MIKTFVNLEMKVINLKPILSTRDVTVRFQAGQYYR
jgi:hypothetical protein